MWDDNVLQPDIGRVSFEYLSFMTTESWFPFKARGRGPKPLIATNANGPHAGNSCSALFSFSDMSFRGYVLQLLKVFNTLLAMCGQKKIFSMELYTGVDQDGPPFQGSMSGTEDVLEVFAAQESKQSHLLVPIKYSVGIDGAALGRETRVRIRWLQKRYLVAGE